MNYVFDACALIAFLRGEPGGEAVRKILKETEAQWHIHSMNAMEFYYIVWKASNSRATAEVAVEKIEKMGIQTLNALHEDIWKEAARIHVIYGIGVADSIALSTAYYLDASLVTKDKKAFEGIAKANLAPVILI